METGITNTNELFLKDRSKAHDNTNEKGVSQHLHPRLPTTRPPNRPPKFIGNDLIRSDEYDADT